MASEKLEGEKPEEEAPVGSKKELNVKEPKEGKQQEEEQKSQELSLKDASGETEEPEGKKEVEEEEEKKVQEGGGEGNAQEAREEKKRLEAAEEEEVDEYKAPAAEDETKEEDKVQEAEGEDEDGQEKASRKVRRSTRKRISKKEKNESKKWSQESNEEPVTPSSDRPTRERKVVERYSVPSVARSSSSKALSIEQGCGTQLKDIPSVAFKLSKRKPDDSLQMLHMILFGKKGKAHTLKRNIGQFSGFVWVENEEKQKVKVKEKLDKCVKEKLLDFCDILNVPASKTTKKEEISVKLLEFLESPHSTSDVLLAEKEQKVKKHKVTPSKNISPGESSGSLAMKQKQTPQSGGRHKRLSKADEEDNEKNESARPKGDLPEDEYDSAPKEESDHEKSKSGKDDGPEKKSKKSSSKKIVKESSGSESKDKSMPRRKAVPAKSTKVPGKPAKESSGTTLKRGSTDADETSKGSVSKKRKVEKESLKGSKDKMDAKKQTNKSPIKDSTKEKGKGKSSKKPKPQPTREEMHAVVVDILKEVDFNTATLSDILRKLGQHFDVDLMDRKAEVKDIITEVIRNMSDEEDEESEESAGAADKDGGGDDDNA
ncbi:hypothetical protein SLEP1_g3670 [Rubroshorea leprosula]|uniref:DEK-C domain-containing protein n=1 Tax=Rubroshorea leprosula TaxID=152421 RepID=A0AAV5HWN3_9ROSI|nr:hypothetical protein SLEP1_g3670 [Rubroshorea leprosula]